MATTTTTTSVTAGDDPVTLICKLCDKTYQHKDGPLMLPCLHSFCKPCLVQYMKKEDSNEKDMAACPTCTSQFTLPKNIDQLPVNLRLSHLAKASMYEKQAEGGNVKCQKCQGTPNNATTFHCNRCLFLCDKCKSDYLRLVDDEDHEFIDLSTYEKGEFKIHSPPAKCPQHKEKLALYCNDCKTLICLYCSQTKHQNHKKSSTDDTAGKEKAKLQQLTATNGVDNVLGIMDQTLQQIQEMRDKVKVSAKEATDSINKMCDELVQAVEKRREVLKAKCQEIAQEKDNVLSDQMIEIQRLRRDLHYAQLHAKDAIHNHSAEEILSVKKNIEQRLSQSWLKYQRQSMDLQEDDIINTTLDIVPVVEEIQKLGSFTGVPDPSKCTFKLLAGIGISKKVGVVLKDNVGEPIRGKRCFQYQLRKVGACPDDYIPPKVTVTQSNDNSCSAILSFTADEQPGEYELTLMARNTPIANTYKIKSKVYTCLPNVEPIYKNVGGQCYGVAVHDNGTVYATNYTENTIKVFRPDGTEGQIGGSDNAGGQLSEPRGIVLLDDTIYVASSGNHTVKMYSTDGRFIGGFGSNGTGSGQFQYPYGLCTDGKRRVLVADVNNKRIQLFSSEGNFIQSITCSDYPFDVAVDPVGNIHVALRDSHHIAVYSENGEQRIETYNLGGQLRDPSGIYIDSEGNRLIATSNGSVHITDSTGALIASRRVNRAYGVTMDKNGSIYVTEYSNSRVAVYS